MAESDLVPGRPTYTAPPRPLGDFGFTGTFVSEETVLAGSLEIKKNKVTLWASGTQLASWKSADCKVQLLEGNQFSIEADEEMITFTADDPEGLISAISAFLTPRSVASDTADVTKPPPKHTPPAVATARPAAKVTVRTEPDARTTAPAPAAKPAETVPAKKSEPPATSSRAAPKPTPTPRASQEPAIRRPRIKAFEARAAEGSGSTLAPESATRSAGGSAAFSPAKPDELQEEVRRLREIQIPVVPAEKEVPTIADRITDTAKRRYKSSKAHRWLKSDIEDVAIKAGVVASTIGIFTLFALTIFIIAGGFRGEPEFVSVPTTTIPPSPTTTVVVTTLPPPPTTLFQTGPAELTDRWNALAEVSRPELVLFTDLTSPFLLSLTPYLTLEGLLDPAAGSVVMRATPTGTPEGDSLILTSLGLLIGISDPTLDGSDRRALLETLGLAIDNPQLGGLDGTVNYNGLFYHLAYLSDQGVIEFRVTPELPAATTTVAP
ncbi:MAG TPA: hypothetical protein VM848_02140 [Acidimicrobiia bacterium]|nr:hypothetical protein [Acidimicrobiia bacterium]